MSTTSTMFAYNCSMSHLCLIFQRKFTLLWFLSILIGWKIWIANQPIIVLKNQAQHKIIGTGPRAIVIYKC